MIREIVERGLRGVEDIQDHSDGRGQRLLIACERGTDPHGLLERLYDSTSLEIDFPEDLVARVGATAERLSLRDLIDRFLAGRDGAAVRDELRAIADRCGDERRTTIVP